MKPPKGKKRGSSQRALFSVVFCDVVVKGSDCLFKILQQQRPIEMERHLSKDVVGQKERAGEECGCWLYKQGCVSKTVGLELGLIPNPGGRCVLQPAVARCHTSRAGLRAGNANAFHPRRKKRSGATCAGLNAHSISCTVIN